MRKGWVRLVRVRPNRVRYLITPRGLAAKARIYREQLSNNLRFYMETRDRIHQRLAAMRHAHALGTGNGQTECRIALYGVGEVAEIGYVCLQGTDLTLVGVIDDAPKQPFFGLPVHPIDRLNGMSLDGVPFDRLMIMSLNEVDAIRQRLADHGVPSAVVHEI
jgi:hypothetical protein